ncbi:hypothetical protein [Novosphingobium colocasiae]|uniref:hypothetical protein n=1 Tax=Novosphingobium colocasiae TaxID=1256513 RepID=UPI0035AF83F0
MMIEIPIDDAARDGASHTFRAADQTMHAASWCAARQGYVYFDGTRVGPTLTHYLARQPGLNGRVR